jgi:tetratricopeptide (TPR) repeat protein
VPVALATYLRLLLWPVGFSILRPERPDLGPFAPAVLAAALALVALAVLAVWAIRRRRELLLPVIWLLVWLAPVLNLWALDRQWMVTDRYLFLPSLALPWALALLLPRRAAPWVLAGIALAFAGLSLRYSAIFASERSFVAAMEVAEPTSPLIFAEKGRLLLRDGDRAGARTALTRAVALDPAAAGALSNLADLELQERQLDAAERHYRQALVVRPEASRGLKLLTLAISRNGQTGRALALAQEAARRWPQDFEAQLIAALLLDAAGQRQAALDAFAAAGRLRPGDPALAGGLDAAESRLLPGLLPPAAGALGTAGAAGGSSGAPAPEDGAPGGGSGAAAQPSPPPP